MNYSDQLKTGTWQERRLTIFKRDSFCCTQCGSNFDLQVHHKDYFPGTKAWEYPDGDLVTLCRKCHTKENDRETHETHLLQSLKASGFSSFEVLALSCYINRYKGFANDVRNLINNAVNNNL
jgi:5-methylcytosine-specific restriction endonuclease McrA